MGPTNVHLMWDAPARQGNDADLAGYRIIKLGAGIKQPTNPRDGTEVCPGLGFRDNDCFVQNLTTGQKVTFEVYALDACLYGRPRRYSSRRTRATIRSPAWRRTCASSG